MAIERKIRRDLELKQAKKKGKVQLMPIRRRAKKEKSGMHIREPFHPNQRLSHRTLPAGEEKKKRKSQCQIISAHARCEREREKTRYEDGRARHRDP